MKKHRFYIGIDTGKNTGFSLWNAEEKRFEIIETMLIHEAIFQVKDLKHFDIFVRVEDARLRRWYGDAGREQLQGAGSIKRDAVIWEDFLTAEKIPFEMVAPRQNHTKLKAKSFQFLTKWEKRTSEHSRDAAMLVFGF